MAITACLGLMGQTQPTPESLLSDPRFQERVIPSPDDPAQWPAFQSELIAYRDAIRQQLNYSDALYRDPKTAWSATAFSCGFIMLNDSVIYDPTTNQFTPDKFINEYMPQFGGFDCVVLWHAYPRLGIDDRNQFDFYKDQPGGLAGLKALVDALHKHNVRVLLPYLPWDRSTRNDGTTHAQSLAACVKALGADGVYLDTMDKATPELRKELDHLPSGMVYDSEGTTPIEDIAHHQNSWGQWVKDSDVPGVIRNKWIEPRHMVRIVERWDRDHSDEIAMAWMNGAGIVVWENVFGTWVGWNELDKSLVRGSLPVQRHFGKLFTGANLTPCVPTGSPAIFANRWQEPGVELYTLVNRLIDERQGNLLKVPYKPGYRYFNLFSGDEITPIDGQVILQGPIAGRALGGLVGLEHVDEAFLSLMTQQKTSAANFNTSRAFPNHQTRLTVPVATAKYSREKLPPNMIEIRTSQHNQARQMRVRECAFYETQTEILQSVPMLNMIITFDVRAEVPHYAIDKTPVTNAEFAAFIQASGYTPEHSGNFLKLWKDGKPPIDLLDHPVVYVSLEDARAYAAWAGKRLPTEDEWQWAAVGLRYTGYPWGGVDLKPDHYNDGSTKSTTPVNAFPAGASAFGCLDMCGNVFQWTESQRTDGRINFCMIKGGSFYKTRGSTWYADNGPLMGHYSVKYILGNPELDRSATIGFRCVVDMQD